MTDQTTDRHTCHNEKTAAGPAWQCPRCSLPPAHPAAPLADRLAHPEAVREQVRRALDFTYAVSLGYESSDQLLATYDASRTPADKNALREIGEAVLAAVEAALGDTLVPSARAEALAGIAAVLPTPTNHDTDTGVTPPPALTEEGRLRARVQVLEEDAERDQSLAATGARCLLRGHQGQIESGHAIIEGHRFALSTKLGLGTDASWDAIHERVADLSRMADEAASDETQAAVTPIRVYLATPCATCDHTLNWHRNDVGCTVTSCACGRFQEPAAGARQDGAQPGGAA